MQTREVFPQVLEFVRAFHIVKLARFLPGVVPMLEQMIAIRRAVRLPPSEFEFVLDEFEQILLYALVKTRSRSITPTTLERQVGFAVKSMRSVSSLSSAGFPSRVNP